MDLEYVEVVTEMFESLGPSGYIEVLILFSGQNQRSHVAYSASLSLPSLSLSSKYMW